MGRCKAVLKLPKCKKPDVLTRLSLAPKTGLGEELWRIIMDMRPENARHHPKKVQMEHLAHFSAVFTGGLLLFSLDLKVLIFWSVSMRGKLGRWGSCGKASTISLLAYRLDSSLYVFFFGGGAAGS